MTLSPALYAHGLVFSESVLHSEWFAVLAAFVAINTVMYCVLTVAKMLPKVYVADWVTSANRRTESRSIYPDGLPPEARRPLG